jgi:hypothetical protein
VVLVDELLPVYDVSDEIATVVGADAVTTWGALMDAGGGVDPWLGCLARFGSCPIWCGCGFMASTRRRHLSA